MKKQIAIRFAIGMFLILGLMLAYQSFKNFSQDPDVGEFDSAGYIAAIESTRGGGRVVMFDASGTRIDAPQPDGKESWDDRGVAWSADGQRLFISSNRKSDAYLIYRWNPAQKKIEVRSIGTRSQMVPWFDPSESGRGKQFGILQSGGQIYELDVKTGDAAQILPATTERIAGEGEGSKAAMDLYTRFGTSFLTARPLGGSYDQWLGLMRNDEGFTVIFQSMVPDQEDQVKPPAEAFRGDRAAIDSATDGTIAVSISGFQFPPYQDVPEQFVKNGKVTKPFESGIFKVGLDVAGQFSSQPVAVIPAGNQAFLDISVSPDGSKIAVVVGNKTTESDFEPEGLLVMPFAEGGGAQATALMKGAISSPSWSADGNELTFLLREGADTNICRMNVDGSNFRKLTQSGMFVSPLFSPAR
jgi:hypothetical protein